MHPVKKIVVIGPESTGKTTLCARLAEQFHSQWVPEYAREYLLAHGKSYSLEDLLVIARGQLALEDQAVAALGRVGSLDRQAIRARFEQRWSATRMAQDYVTIYKGLAG